VKRIHRLTKSNDFQRVRRNGRSYAHPLIVLIASPNDLVYSRFGVTAGKSIGNAVKRNRSKRVIRAVLQSIIPEIIPGWDLILIARKPSVDASFQQMENALKGLLQRAKLI
jgi:ribonuclease P protein component